jgi:hypothetical protein
MQERNKDKYRGLRNAMSTQYGNWRGGFNTQQLRRQNLKKVDFSRSNTITINPESVNIHGGNA